MSSKTSIEWTDATWNCVRGCSRVSEGCRHCYAETVAARFSGPGQPYEGLAKMVKRDVRQFEAVGGEPTGNFRTVARSEARWTGEVRLIPEHLMDPLRWRKPRRIFANSMSDLFHDALPDSAIDQVVAVMLIQALHATKGGHTIQTLTKRAARMLAYFSDPKTQGRVAVAAGKLMEDGDGWHDTIAFRPEGLVHPLLWWGVSVENQATADERIPLLLKTPAAVRFLSCEPLLGPVDLTRIAQDSVLSLDAVAGIYTYPIPIPHAKVDWVIAGCESGLGARPAQVDWYRSLRDQCAAAGVAFFLKQAVNEHYYGFGPSGAKVDLDGACNVGIAPGPGTHRKRAGVGHELLGAPYLDGRQHLEMPRS